MAARWRPPRARPPSCAGWRRPQGAAVGSHAPDERPLFYLLDGHEPRPATFPEWAEWYTSNAGVAGRTLARDWVGGTEISTVFLGRAAGLEEPPLLFETMTFSRTGQPGLQWRYATWDDALAGHAAAVDLERQ